MDFIKMHGLGNDFVVLDELNGILATDPAALARRICLRRQGIGADGLVRLLPSEKADACMRIYNPDGSEPEMCGNAVRCAAKYLYESGACRKERIRLETLAGIREIGLTVKDGRMLLARVDMGIPAFKGEIRIGTFGQERIWECVSTGNPHAVSFGPIPSDEVFFSLGPLIEKDPAFPEGTNVEFVRIDGWDRMTIRFWERGAGATLACGTGATASYFAAHRAGLVGDSVTAVLPGGELMFETDKDGHVFMTGPAEESFRGCWEHGT